MREIRDNTNTFDEIDRLHTIGQDQTYGVFLSEKGENLIIQANLNLKESKEFLQEKWKKLQFELKKVRHVFSIERIPLKYIRIENQDSITGDTFTFPTQDLQRKS